MDKTMFDERYELYLSEIERFLAAQFEEMPHWADLYESMYCNFTQAISTNV